jgi:hypothetical protein
MNEPLITSRPGISFCGKAHNNHPQWYNQPLRLNKEQKRDPLLVMEEFFQCYHLNETRQTLWEWLTEVVSSSQSNSNGIDDRNDDMFFYEKIEELIEAAFILKKKLHKRRLKNEKRKLKRDAKATAIQANEMLEPVNQFNKEKRLIEYVNENPFYVISEVLKPGHRSFIIHAIHDWLLIALSTEDPSYDEADQRQNLITFKDQLISFIEALYIILIISTEEGEFKDQLKVQYKISFLTNDQIANPAGVLTEFFTKYSMIYIQRELEDWLDAGINNNGPWREDITSAWHVINTYRNVRCLIKAAKRLLDLKAIPLK